MTAYYNEIDPDAVLILRALIADGVIAPGDVDTRSIKDVQPDDLRPYTQCHFFAGGGLWSVAARRAGWPDARPVWTASCPCQPFSQAGKRAGADDPRHLWPNLFRLIRARRPVVVVGEQVAGQAGYGWFDGVRADLEGEGYAGRGVDIPACAVDAPHIRQRLYWCAVADAKSGRSKIVEPRPADSGEPAGKRQADQHIGRNGGNGPLAYAEGQRSGRDVPIGRSEQRTADGRFDAECGALDYAIGARLEGHAGHGDGAAGRAFADRPVAAADVGGGTMDDAVRVRDGQSTGSVSAGRHIPEHADDPRARRNGSWWSDAEWIACHDGKARRAQPGSPLLVDGLPGRVGLWRVAGNAISPVLAAEVIGALMDTLDAGDVA
jgi:DNA (cytosine-5)-methyltransferase 1